MTAVWIATASALTLSAVVVWGTRRRLPRMMTVPGASAGAGPFVTLGAALAIAVLAVATAILASRTPAGASSRQPRGNTVFVLDVSGSVSGGHAVQLGEMLRVQALRIGPTAGLVIFADSATEALPARTPAVEVAKLARFFRIAGPDAVDRFATNGSTIYATRAPWPGAFLGNTVISTGIDLARRMLSHVQPVGRDGRIVVISDLKDGESDRRLGRAIERALRDGLVVLAAPVGATEADVATWLHLGGGVESTPQRPGPGGVLAAVERRPSARSLAPAGSAIAFGLLVAAALLWTRPLRLPPPQRSRAPGQSA